MGRGLLSIAVAAWFVAAPSLSADDPKSLVEPGARVVKLAGGMKFTEGTVWIPEEKKVVFSDIPNS